jgi:hypothetical protein
MSISSKLAPTILIEFPEITPYRYYPQENNCTCTRGPNAKVSFAETGSVGQADFILVRYSATNNGLPSNRLFRLQGSVNVSRRWDGINHRFLFLRLLVPYFDLSLFPSSPTFFVLCFFHPVLLCCFFLFLSCFPSFFSYFFSFSYIFFFFLNCILYSGPSPYFLGVAVMNTCWRQRVAAHSTGRSACSPVFLSSYCIDLALCK